MSTTEQEAPKVELTPEDHLKNLKKMNEFRLQVLRAQVEFDFVEGRPQKSGRRIKPSVRNNNRVMFDALDIMQGKKAFRSVDEYEKRSVASMVEFLNSLMLKIVQDKTDEQINLKKGEEDGQINDKK